MSDDNEFGPDANQVRRHAKKLYTEAEYRKLYRKLDFFDPNAVQRAFLNLPATERLLRGGNQTGKTTAGAICMSYNALALYPSWYQGHRYDKKPAIIRPVDFVGWAGSTTESTC